MSQHSIRCCGVATATPCSPVSPSSRRRAAPGPAPARARGRSSEADRRPRRPRRPRRGRSPTAAQKAAPRARLGAPSAGTASAPRPRISPADGTLGPATSGDAGGCGPRLAGLARRLLGLTAAQIDGLELVSNQQFAGSDARAVLFRQDFGGPAPALGSMVTVGVGDGAIQYVSSSLVRTSATSVPRRRSPPPPPG